MMSMLGSGRIFSFLSERRYCPSACHFLLTNLQCSHNRGMVVKPCYEQPSDLHLITHLSCSHHWVSSELYRTFFVLGEERVTFLIRKDLIKFLLIGNNPLFFPTYIAFKEDHLLRNYLLLLWWKTVCPSILFSSNWKLE